MELKDNLIIIGPSYMKKNILKENNLKYNVKYIDEHELKEIYLYKYKDSILTYVDKKYNLIPEISSIILNNLYEIKLDENYETDKLNKLKEIKKDLYENNYIQENKNFKAYLKNKEILVIDTMYDKKIKKIIDELETCNNVKYIKEEVIKKDNIEIYEFKTLEEEVCFVASKIVELIKNGVDINNIKVNTLSSEYKTVAMKIFSFYNIPNQFKNNKLFHLYDVKLFLKQLEDNIEILEINNILDELDINDKIKDKLINIFNKYVDYKYYGEIKEEIIYELKNTSVTLNDYDNVVKEIDYKSYLPTASEHIFLMGLNQDKIPKIHKDDKYLSDKELKSIDSDTSLDLNKKENTVLTRFINETKNIYISYKLSSSFNEYAKANFIKELDNVKIISKTYEFNNNKINEINLASYLDNYIKYNEKHSDLGKLLYNYKNIEYANYSNNYTKISKDTIKKQLDNKLNLSFTNTNTFFRCKFRFLLDTIYKLSTFEETLSQKIGNLFHDALCIIYKEKKTYDEVIDEVINKYFSEPNNKDLFYIEKYKQALQKLLNILNMQLDKTEYENEYFEEWFSVEKKDDLEFKIVGKIDKILTLKDGINTYVIVIDYKTGSMHGDFNKVIHGLDMQLLYYLYLIKNTSKINNPKFTGMYLQSIMTEVLSSEKNKTYDDIVKENMKLFGYTIDDVNKLSLIDKDYDIGSYIQGIKVKNDGTFYAYSKVLKEETIDELIDIVDKNLNEVMTSIKDCSFEINPKKLGNTLVGCEYCTFKDICYMNNENIVELENYKNLEFLGGDNNDTN